MSEQYQPNGFDYIAHGALFIGGVLVIVGLAVISPLWGPLWLLGKLAHRFDPIQEPEEDPPGVWG